MKTKEKPETRELILQACFTIIPMIMLASCSEFVSDDSGTRILLSGVMGAAGGGVGYGAYSVTRRRSAAVRWIAAVVLLAASVILVRVLHERHERKLEEELELIAE